MAKLHMTTGGPEADATLEGPEMPLKVIEARLGTGKVKFLSTLRPQSIRPVMRNHDHVVIEVTETDPKTGEFDKTGFYQVLNITRSCANVLFAPSRLRRDPWVRSSDRG
jgi:hypothetical protein